MEMAETTCRQKFINTLYFGHCEAGDDDMNARERVRADMQEFIDTGGHAVFLDIELDKMDVEEFIKTVYPISDAELDAAEEAYLEEEFDPSKYLTKKDAKE
jgi:hypothetical protein